MFLQKNNFLFTICFGCFVAIDANFDFTATLNAYFGDTSTKFDGVSEIGCCTICGTDESCLAVNYNHQTSECELITQYPDSSMIVENQDDWVLYTLDGCDDSWIQFKRNCYLLVETQMLWTDANDHCATLNANLVDIHSQEENAFVDSLNPPSGYSNKWIGLNDIEVQNTFVWSSGNPLTYTSWYPTYPATPFADNCVGIDGLTWHDNSCVQFFPSVCEKPIRRLVQ